MADTASEETAAKDQEYIGEDGTEHAGLHDANLAVFEGDDTNLSYSSAPMVFP